MKKTLLILCCMAAAVQTVAAQGFKNPVLAGFYPDPSVCRVGDDFYLVTSTFEYFPGVPVFHSKDLIHWTQLGHCLTRDSQLELHGVKASGGIYAPSIRWHDGLFYMVTTNRQEGKGNFYVTASDPSGPWSDPVWLEQGGIDPHLHFEPDGRAYLISKARRDGVYMSEIDLASGKSLAKPHLIWNGSGGRHPEGPHLYKKDGYYYLLIAEGGTEWGHMVTVARSRDLWGPYEGNPANPILTHRDYTGQGIPIQGVGHADLVEAADGSWWLVTLGFRPMRGTKNYILGRETFLAPVRWNGDGWPVVNGNGTIATDMDVPTLRQTVPAPQRDVTTFDAPAIAGNSGGEGVFDIGTIGFEWNHLRNPARENYSLAVHPGWLALRGTSATLDRDGSPTFVGRRQQHFDCTATVTMRFAASEPGAEAGLTVFMNPRNHYDLAVVNRGGERRLEMKIRLGKIETPLFSVPLPADEVRLRVACDGNSYTFSYAAADGAFREAAAVDARYISVEAVGSHTGVYFGLYAEGSAAQSAEWALFDDFSYRGR